ncbi:MAG: transglutaminase family protein [Thermodesulfobacteriota bacterium]
MDMTRSLSDTPLLDWKHPLLSTLVNDRRWNALDPYEKIGAAYTFVKDEIAFGFNEADNIPASRVLEDGYGQCNTKTTLLMALLRSMDVPCRIHGFGIDKRVQKGIVPGIVYAFAPRILLHTWVEVQYGDSWLHLEGSILDSRYLSGVQAMHTNGCGSFCGYGVAVEDMRNPPVQWQGTGTYIQHNAIVEDYGIFDTPDELYRQRGTNFGRSSIRRVLFKHIVRKAMNARVRRIRNGRGARP